MKLFRIKNDAYMLKTTIRKSSNHPYSLHIKRVLCSNEKKSLLLTCSMNVSHKYTMQQKLDLKHAFYMVLVT